MYSFKFWVSGENAAESLAAENTMALMLSIKKTLSLKSTVRSEKKP